MADNTAAAADNTAAAHMVDWVAEDRADWVVVDNPVEDTDS